MMDILYAWFGVSNEEEAKKKKAQVFHSSSVQQHNKRPDVSIRRVRSNVGGSTINEDELVASFTNIETDSAIDSGVDEDDEINPTFQKNKLRRVESKEHLVGEEEYVVVDFVGNVEVSSRKSSKVEIDVESAIGSLSPTQSPISTSSTFDIVGYTPAVYSTEKVDPDDVKVDVNIDADIEVSKVEERRNSNKKVYSVGRGLKGLKQQKKEEPVQVSEDSKSDRSSVTSSTNSLNAASKTSISSDREPIMTRSASSRDMKNSALEETPKMRRASSTRSTASDNSKPISVVMQNKMLFDQQISGQLRRKQSTESRSSQVDLSNFDRSESGSFSDKRKESIRSLHNELPASGTVAGARSMFESGNIKPITPMGSRKTSLQTMKETKPDKTNEKEHHSFKSDQVIETSTPKKKRFPFKKKKNDKIDESPKKFKIGSDNKSSKVNDVELISVKENENNYEERAIDVPEESLETEKKKKGLFSRIRKHSRKGSDSSDSERKMSFEKPHAPVERTPSGPEIIEEKDEVILSDQPVEVETKDEITEDTTVVNTDLFLDLQIPRSNTETSLPTPDVPPPSPGYASSEIQSILENIIDRRPSFHTSTSITGEEEKIEGTPKKKRLGFKLKKKSSSKKLKATKPEETTPDVVIESIVDVETKSDVKVTVETLPESDNVGRKLILDEFVPIEIIQNDKLISDWSMDEMNGEVDILEKVEEEETHVETIQENEGISVDVPSTIEFPDVVHDSPKTANPSIELSVPSVEVSLTEKTEDVEGERHEDDLVAMLEQASPAASPTSESPSESFYGDDLSIVTDATDVSSISPEKKKKKLNFHFPIRRKSSSKKDKKEKEKHDDNIWEDSYEKKSSKKLKRPKSLDFLAEKIYHSDKKSDKANRPVSMSQHDFETVKNNGGDMNGIPEGGDVHHQKSHKKKTLSLFRKKKKHTSEPVPIPTNRVKNETDLPLSSPTEASPDVFTIPENNSNVVLSNDKTDGVLSINGKRLSTHSNDEDRNGINGNDSLHVNGEGLEIHASLTLES